MARVLIPSVPPSFGTPKEISKMGTDLLRYHLPIELVSEILSWSPVTSICRFTCVCKSWCALITNPNFITTHTRRREQNHRRSDSNTPPALLLRCHGWRWGWVDSIGWGRVDEKPRDCDPSKLTLYDITTFRKHLEIENPLHMHKFVGSCGGLICLSRRSQHCYGQYGEDLYLWNPIIHRVKAVPNSSSSIYNLIIDFLKMKIKIHHRMVVGFGFHEQADDYKIIRIAYFSGHGDKVPPPAAEVYSSRTDSWTTVEAKVPDISSAFAIRFVNGAIYWCVSKGDEFVLEDMFFMSFDFNREVFQMIRPPPPFPLTCRDMVMLPTVIKDGSFNSQLAIGTSDAVCRYSWDIWMPKYEKEGISTWTWSKKFRNKINKSLILLRGIIGDEKLLFSSYTGDLFTVDVENQHCEAIGVDIQASSKDLAFMESLALLDLGPANLGPAVH